MKQVPRSKDPDTPRTSTSFLAKAECHRLSCTSSKVPTMAKIYLSSTFIDLEEYRSAVYDVLRRMQHDVIAMEDYVATDDRPLAKCLKDVASCDLYLGIFAWRYGFVPTEGNPERKSVTELEYRTAGTRGIPRLIFLLDSSAPWPPSWMDTHSGDSEQGARIKALRAELEQNHLKGRFKTPEQLASLVTTSVHLWGSHVTEVALNNISVLYVEDMREYVDIYRPVLEEQFGPDNIMYAATAGKALKIIEDMSPPDVVIADLFLPSGPGYVIPEAAEGLPRVGGFYAYGADVCASAFQRGIPVVALSTAPIGHPVRGPVDQARQKHGGMVRHLHKRDNLNATQIASVVRELLAAPSETELLPATLHHLLTERWPDAAGSPDRMAILNEVHMALGSASKPAFAALATDSSMNELHNLLALHQADSEDEQSLIDELWALVKLRGRP
jgi:CheY-like chemotaxis protein